MSDTPGSCKARLEAIAERHANAERHQWIVAYNADHIAVGLLLSELTQAQEQLRRCAEVMREGAARLEQADEPYYRCCDLKSYGGKGHHAPDCLVTKLRQMADEAEGK